jgi:putative ABC transport system permease protein
MTLIETTKIAIVALNANKVRSALTMLGVIIGVFAVVSMISLGRGVQNYITDQFSALGSDLIIVSPGKVDLQDDPAKYLTRNKLDEKHLDLIRAYADDFIINLTPSVRVAQSMKHKTNSHVGTVIGADYTLPEVLNFEAKEGRFFTRNEVKSNAKVVVIGPIVSEELYPSRSPVGEKIKLGDETFEIIGVFKEKNQQYDSNAFAPYTTVMEVFDVKNFSSIGVKAKDTESIDIGMRQVELALMRDLKDDDFTVMSQQDLLGSIQSILGILTLGLGAIAGISLLVGGIGIMNIMLVSVTERIREIGLRKAVGANSYNIGMQFMAESVLLSVTGGMIGLFLGWLASLAARTFVRTDLPISAIFLAFGFSVFVGVVFGTYPAMQASKKDPIDALRYE